MLPYFGEKWGNPSSREHVFGWDAAEAVEEARFEVAGLINAKPNEIVFTGSATESLFLALQGYFRSAPYSRGIVASTAEHDAVLAACRDLEGMGASVGYLAVDGLCRIAAENLESTLAASGAGLACLIAANNETGTLLPIRECAASAHSHGALLLIDAAQALGKTPLDADADGFDMAAFSAHKIHGPKGIGALYLKGGPEAAALRPPMPGGGQESGMRGGTPNVPAIVGFGEACRLAKAEMEEESQRLWFLRDRLEASLADSVPGIRVNGDPVNRLPQTSNLLFPGVDARTLVRDMHQVAVSTRSACSSGANGPSHVLKAMGLSDEDAFASVRFSLGRLTTEEEIDRAAAIAAASYRRLRRDLPES